jgi:hypothetical protein
MAEFDRLELVAATGLFLGVLAMGLAMGAAIGLATVQSACIEAGALPQPGAHITGVVLANNQCYQKALGLQRIANYSGYAAAGLLLGGAVLDTYDEAVRERLGWSA